MKKQLSRYIACICLGLGAGNAAADLDEGLVAYYPFKGNVNDESGNSYHGTVQGALITADRFGNLGAYGFDGDDSRIKLDGEALNSLNSLTIAFWLQSFDSGSGKHWFSAANSKQANEFLVGHDNGKIVLMLKGKDHKMSDVKINDNSWHHIVFTREGSIMELYIDSRSDSVWDSAPVGNLSVEKSGLWLGGDQDSVGGDWASSQQFDGLLDDLRIYDRALDETEIQELYNLPDSSVCSDIPMCSQAELDAAKEAGRQACIDDPSSCGISTSTTGFTQAELDAAKEAGRQACIDDPSSCGISISGIPATLSADFKLHIPLLRYFPLAESDAFMPMLVDMEMKDYSQLLFRVTGYEVIE